MFFSVLHRSAVVPSLHLFFSGNQAIQIFHPSGKWIKTICNNTTDAVLEPTCLAVCPSGDIVITEYHPSGFSRVRMFSPEGDLVHILRDVDPRATQGFIPHDSMKSVWGVAVDGVGNILVGTTRGNQLLVYSSEGKLLKTIEGAKGPLVPVIAPNGNLLVLSRDEFVQVFE